MWLHYTHWDMRPSYPGTGTGTGRLRVIICSPHVLTCSIGSMSGVDGPPYSHVYIGSNGGQKKSAVPWAVYEGKSVTPAGWEKNSCQQNRSGMNCSPFHSWEKKSTVSFITIEKISRLFHNYWKNQLFISQMKQDWAVHVTNKSAVNLTIEEIISYRYTVYLTNEVRISCSSHKWGKNFSVAHKFTRQMRN